jgi:ADP-ribosylglycohydrolase
VSAAGAADAVVGAIVGDIVGSVHESRWRKVPHRDFPLLTPRSHVTDDTVLTVAVAEAVRTGSGFEGPMVAWGQAYPDAGYGGRFRRWLATPDRRPYGSYGNGSAMRVSAVAYASDDLSEVLALTEASARVTHDHPEGVRGAQAVAGAILLGRLGASASDVRDLVTRFGYDLETTVDQWRESTMFDVTCQGTVPAAVRSVLEAGDLESAVRNAVFIGGDADTLAAIAGSVAAALYGMPADLRAQAWSRLDEYLVSEVDRFEVWEAGR